MTKTEKEYITLQQFLKYKNVVNSGGEAKVRILSGDVKVNGELETRRGRKLYSKDTVQIDGKVFKVE